MKIKTTIATVLILLCGLIFSACSGPKKEEPAEIVLSVYVPEEMLELMVTVADRYTASNPDTKFGISFDTSAMLAAKIADGYPCDIYISGDESAMDWLDGSKGSEENPNGHNFILEGTRTVFMISDATEGEPGDEVVDAPGSDNTGAPGGEGANSSENDDSGTVEYSVACIRFSRHPEEAKGFIEYIKGGECDEICASLGFRLIEQ